MALLLDILVSAAGLAVVACYVWSVRSHFSSPTVPSGAKVISLAVVLTAALDLWLTFRGGQPLWAQVAGLAMIATSTALFWWAIAASRSARLRFAYDPEGPRGLVTEGPYRLVRHPFYASYLVFWAGWALSTANLWAAPPVALFLVLYILAARQEERLFTATPMAEAYRRYRKETGFLFPRLRRPAPSLSLG